MKKIEFKSWEDIDKLLWIYHIRLLPIGQKWGYDAGLGLITNGHGEGFTIHRSTRYDEIVKLIDALNKRDAQIAELTDNS